MKPSDDETMNEEVMVECELDAATEKVWRALTVPEIVREWLGAKSTHVAGETSYELVDAEPFTRVRYAWHDPETEPAESLVTFEIAPRDQKTFFRVIHSISNKADVPRAANTNIPPRAMAA
ncbi:uncharacterized protein YndB with AHSA1/START domain [Mesorhizobium sp. J18]|uniref:SRPBCC family protein n=1 Tax=Mesorhizobium sp. J18 TaxID=935263 RepID=UPI00119982C9|nr:SRPBCC domain-containing protein [Mesorhizobium sp. J18]TWH01283.1 uncharacterized protein YndB with AHSA1/START domain [Mesorhizobium sp. J18]